MSLIGQWVQRESPSQVVTLAHFVESEIADRVVTRCGRQMQRHTGRGDITVTDAGVYCSRCEPLSSDPADVVYP